MSRELISNTEYINEQLYAEVECEIIIYIITLKTLFCVQWSMSIVKTRIETFNKATFRQACPT